MKYAIALTGNIRTWEQTKDSFISTFGPLNADIFVSTYDLQYGYHPAIQSLMNEHEDNKVSDNYIEEQLKGLNLVYVQIDSHSLMSEFFESQKINFNPNFRDLGSAYGQYRKYKKTIDDIQKYEIMKDFKYDYIIKTRFDLVYDSFNVDRIDKNIIIDAGNVFPNDVVVAGKRDKMINMANYMLEEFYHQTDSTSHLQAPHGLLLSSIKHISAPIEVQRIVKHVLRKNGKIQVY
jgi:hypothetical protein